jgi:hypothetical protein
VRRRRIQIRYELSPSCPITPTHRASSGTVSPSPCGMLCAANAVLNRLLPAADRPEMIIYRVDTSAITGVNDGLCCLRADGPKLHIVTNKGVKPTATPSLHSPAHAESSMHHRFSIVNAYREMVLRGSPTARAHNNMLLPILDALARPTFGRSVTHSHSYSRAQIWEKEGYVLRVEMRMVVSCC